MNKTLREEWRKFWQTRRGPNGLSDYEKEWNEGNGPGIADWWLEKTIPKQALRDAIEEEALKAKLHEADITKDNGATDDEVAASEVRYAFIDEFATTLAKKLGV